eukprot:TRINITY_DN1585_c0_g3_i2.p1 TRINITY_DN1585_c0_g3~~TRINITY_DN1585_c0_g3_i2.p1  ORF type:complete len:80 (-),score=20.35 TRINITY_DN1585_c0_g3_i2:16-255(-)
MKPSVLTLAFLVLVGVSYTLCQCTSPVSVTSGTKYSGTSVNGIVPYTYTFGSGEKNRTCFIGVNIKFSGFAHWTWNLSN